MSRLTVGTDCSGVGTPVMALLGLGVNCHHVFASEICPIAKATLAANVPADVIYSDIYDRPLVAPLVVDLYIAGFPCQPFSVAGLRQGFEAADHNGRLFFRIREYIRRTHPKAFILENVSGLLSMDDGNCLLVILQSLQALEVYNVWFQELNTKDHGVPQNRPRVFFVGIRKDVDSGSFRFPDPLGATPSIEPFLDPRSRRPCFADLPPKESITARLNVNLLLRAIGDQGHDPFNESWILDCDSSTSRAKGLYNMSPCLTRSRAKGHWISSRGRRMRVSEMLRLQGWFGSFTVVSTDLQLGQLLGNAMSINVLQRLYCSLLPAIGWCKLGQLQDPWPGCHSE